MQINFAAFHAEYWVYALAGLVMIVVGTLLYTVDSADQILQLVLIEECEALRLSRGTRQRRS